MYLEVIRHRYIPWARQLSLLHPNFPAYMYCSPNHTTDQPSSPAMSSPSTVPAHTEDASKGHFQLGERVEARFGGKSKWFPGKIRRARERPDGFLYDIVYDDGDSEEAVFAGRVRRPGQAPPSPRPGWAVDVKLARKGKV